MALQAGNKPFFAVIAHGTLGADDLAVSALDKGQHSQGGGKHQRRFWRKPARKIKQLVRGKDAA